MKPSDRWFIAMWSTFTIAALTADLFALAGAAIAAAMFFINSYVERGAALRASRARALGPGC